MADGGPPVLSVSGLRVAVRVGAALAYPVDDLSLTLTRGTTLVLVGESGCGKSMTALALLDLLTPPATVVAGRFVWHGEELAGPGGPSPHGLGALRGDRLAMVFQEPSTALNPVMRIGTQVAEAVRRELTAQQRRTRVLDLLAEVGLAAPEQVFDAYPHQLSGGMRQRVMIAMALACEPEVLVADEPTTALDTTTQAQILRLLRRIQDQRGTALLFITHDLALLPHIADRVAVMYAGRIVEYGEAAPFLRGGRHPYAAALHAVRRLGPRGEPLATIPGTVPALGALPEGCAFAPRCKSAQPRCRTERPELGAADVAPPLADSSSAEGPAPGQTDVASRRSVVACHFPLAGTEPASAAAALTPSAPPAPEAASGDS